MSDLKQRQDNKIPDLAKPSVTGLVYLLRHKELWPKGFKWAFSNCNTCAMGLLACYWWGYAVGGDKVHNGQYLNVAVALGMEGAHAYNIFLHNPLYSVTGQRDVTPEVIADRLEAYLACR